MNTIVEVIPEGEITCFEYDLSTQLLSLVGEYWKSFELLLSNFASKSEFSYIMSMFFFFFFLHKQIQKPQSLLPHQRHPIIFQVLLSLYPQNLIHQQSHLPINQVLLSSLPSSLKPQHYLLLVVQMRILQRLRQWRHVLPQSCM